MTPDILRLIIQFAMMYHVDPYIVESVIQVESSWNTKASGMYGEVGLMQLYPKYFNQPVAYLKKDENNIRLGVQHLAKMKKECPHKTDNTWIICYNLGVVGAAKIKYPKKFPYYKKVMFFYKKRIERDKHEVENRSL